MKCLLSLCLLLFSIPALSSEIAIEPVTLREGMEGATMQSGALDAPENYAKNKVYREQKELSREADFDLDRSLDEYHVKAFKKKPPPDKAVHYQLFYNSISAPQCRREYLIQKVRQTKIFYRKNGGVQQKTVKHLVEVFKLNSYKEMKRADAHHQLHFLGNATSRKTIVEVQVGCGEIPGIAQGHEWPFEEKHLYERLQDYSDEIGLYGKVSFDFSKSYSFTSEFDRNGHKLTLPFFLAE